MSKHVPSMCSCLPFVSKHVPSMCLCLPCVSKHVLSVCPCLPCLKCPSMPHLRSCCKCLSLPHLCANTSPFLPCVFKNPPSACHALCAYTLPCLCVHSCFICMLMQTPSVCSCIMHMCTTSWLYLLVTAPWSAINLQGIVV